MSFGERELGRRSQGRSLELKELMAGNTFDFRRLVQEQMSIASVRAHTQTCRHKATAMRHTLRGREKRTLPSRTTAVLHRGLKWFAFGSGLRDLVAY